MAEIDQPAIMKELSEVKQSLAGMTARLDANLQRNRDEIDALFAFRTEQEKRIAKIERSYVPQGDCLRRTEEIKDSIGRGFREAKAERRDDGQAARVSRKEDNALLETHQVEDKIEIESRMAAAEAQIMDVRLRLAKWFGGAIVVGAIANAAITAAIQWMWH